MRDGRDITMVNLFEEGFFDHAFEKMSHKKKNAGIDGIRGIDLPEYWLKNGKSITEELLTGTYIPSPATKHAIPKPGKKEKRILEIPCVIDRVIQKALSELLSTYYDETLKDESYAFRTGRGQHDAIFKCQDIISENYETALDLDIKSFFDNVNHDLMMNLLKRNITDKAILNTIRTYLKMKVVYGNHVYQKHLGLCQGSALSPLLSNIYLNEFDCFLKENDMKFIRYADDVIIFFHKETDAESALTEIETFLNEKCRLRLNPEKTTIVQSKDICFLGYGFDTDPSGNISMVLNNKTKEKMYLKMSEHIKKSDKNTVRWWQRQSDFNRGWINYYRYIDYTNMRRFLDEADKKQIELVKEKIKHSKYADSKEIYIDSLKKCINFVGVKEWFDHICR